MSRGVVNGTRRFSGFLPALKDGTSTGGLGELRGYPAKIIVTLDPERQQLAILVMSGKWQESESIARTIIPVNPELRFFE